MAGWKNLEYDSEEMVDHPLYGQMPLPPTHPPGMRFCLTGRELEMCGLPMPTVGDLLDCRIMAEVTATSADRVELQMILIRCENEDTEEVGEDGPEAREQRLHYE